MHRPQRWSEPTFLCFTHNSLIHRRVRCSIQRKKPIFTMAYRRTTRTSNTPPYVRLTLQGFLGSHYVVQTGWIMWTILLSGLSLGARIACHDGSPLHPSPAAFLSFIDAQNVSHFGTSPRYLAELLGRGMKPEQWKFEALRSILSTGAPLTPPLFTWAQKAFGGERVHLFSTSGGTDICASCTSPY